MMLFLCDTVLPIIGGALVAFTVVLGFFASLSMTLNIF
jgi:hypothetical protein